MKDLAYTLGIGAVVFVAMLTAFSLVITGVEMMFSKEVAKYFITGVLFTMISYFVGTSVNFSLDLRKK